MKACQIMALAWDRWLVDRKPTLIKVVVEVRHLRELERSNTRDERLLSKNASSSSIESGKPLLTVAMSMTKKKSHKTRCILKTAKTILSWLTIYSM